MLTEGLSADIAVSFTGEEEKMIEGAVARALDRRSSRSRELRAAACGDVCAGAVLEVGLAGANLHLETVGRDAAGDLRERLDAGVDRRERCHVEIAVTERAIVGGVLLDA